MCHGDNAEGGVGPTLHHGPTPLDIQEQLDANPQMGVIVSELNPDVDDLVALSVYIGELGGNSTDAGEIAQWRAELTAMLEAKGRTVEFALSARDQKCVDIQSVRYRDGRLATEIYKDVNKGNEIYTKM